MDSGYAATGLRGYGATGLRDYVATRLRGYAVTRLRGYAATRLRGYVATRLTLTVTLTSTLTPTLTLTQTVILTVTQAQISGVRGYVATVIASKWPGILQLSPSGVPNDDDDDDNNNNNNNNIVFSLFSLPSPLGITRFYCTLASLFVFSLARSLQLILEISATYRLVSYLLADN